MPTLRFLMNGELDTVTDEVPTALTITPTLATASSAQAKYGTKSILCPVSGATRSWEIDIPSGGNTKVGAVLASNYTIEFWLWFDSVATANGLAYPAFKFSAYSSTLASELNFNLLQQSGAAAGFRRFRFDEFTTAYASSTFDLAYSAWHHVAFVNEGGVWTTYADGVRVSQATGMLTAFPGVESVYANSRAAGLYMDDVCLWEGALYSGGTYTMPSARAVEVFVNGSALTAPLGQVSAFSGANVEVTPAPPSLLVVTGAGVTLAAPAPTISSTGHDSTGEQAAALTAPSPSLSVTAGGNTTLASPSPTLDAFGTVTVAAAADLTAPSPALAAAGTVDAMAQADLYAPSPNLVGYSGAVVSITLTGSPTVQATGTTGGVGNIEITAPLFELTSTATAQNYGSANLLAPSPQLGGQAQTYLIAPGATLTAIGSAVVTATYEAYALNLGHTPRRDNQKPTDETTHFTNFPFTHIVRYQNSYFGANSTGLYLLEGTTDNGTPIEWEVKTAFTDFDSAQLKTLEMAYFGGRMGPETAIDLYAGELVTNPYEYVTPRGATAQNYRQAFGRGQKARYYALGASGNDVVSIDSLTLNVATLARKV